MERLAAVRVPMTALAPVARPGSQTSLIYSH